MIKGLNFDISSAEMKAILKREAAHNVDRELFYQEKLEGLDPELITSNSSGDLRGSMQRKVKNHRSEAIKLRFLLEHVIPDETYRLTETDLRSIGVLPDRY